MYEYNANVQRLVGVGCLFLVLSTFIVSLRIWSKRLKRLPLFADDYLTLIALVCFYAFTALLFINVAYNGVGQEESTVTAEQTARSAQIEIAQEGVWAAGLGCIKSAICIMLARIFFTKSFRIASYVVMAICIAWAVMTILLSNLICSNDNSIACKNEAQALAAIAGIDSFTDLLIIILPQPYVWNLQIKKRQKVVLAGILAVGAISVVMSLLRLAVVLNGDFFGDISSMITYAYIWSTAELGSAIIVACGPLLKPAFKVMHTSSTSLLRSSRKINTSNSRERLHSYDNGARSSESKGTTEFSKGGGATSTTYSTRRDDFELGDMA